MLFLHFKYFCLTFIAFLTFEVLFFLLVMLFLHLKACRILLYLSSTTSAPKKSTASALTFEMTQSRHPIIVQQLNCVSRSFVFNNVGYLCNSIGTVSQNKHRRTSRGVVSAIKITDFKEEITRFNSVPQLDRTRKENLHRVRKTLQWETFQTCLYSKYLEKKGVEI